MVGYIYASPNINHIPGKLGTISATSLANSFWNKKQKLFLVDREYTNVSRNRRYILYQL